MTIDKDKYGKFLMVVGNYFANKGWIYLLLVSCLYVLYKATVRTSLPVFMALSLLPLGIFAFY